MRIEEIRATAVEHGRDPDAIELTVWQGSYKPGGAFDLDLAKQYADLGVTRFVVSAQEGGGTIVRRPPPLPLRLPRTDPRPPLTRCVAQTANARLSNAAQGWLAATMLAMPSRQSIVGGADELVHAGVVGGDAASV